MPNRTATNFWLDLFSLVVMVGLAATGGLVHYVLPAGSGHSYSLFGLGRHDYGQIHFYLAVTAIGLLGLHVLLHWSWICGVVGKATGRGAPSRRARTIWGVSLLFGVVLLTGAGLWWAAGAVEHSTTEPGRRAWRDQAPRRPAPRALASVGEPAVPSGSPEIALRAVGTPRPSREKPGAAPPVTTPSPRAPLSSQRGGHEKHLEDCPAGASISGRSSLGEAAQRCGVSVEAMRQHLNLPRGVAPGERLGRLKRRYGFAIHDVRRLACR